MAAKKSKGGGMIATGLVAQNRRARHDYTIEDTIEAGLMLTGSEVKSLRLGRGSITEAFAGDNGGSIWLMNAHIPEYEGARNFGHTPRRERKLLLHRRQIEKLVGSVRRDGVTIVPLRLYFNDRGIAKLQVGLAKGKRQVDKRHDAKDRDWKRDQARLLRRSSDD
jgi:SsrA-binding protein